MSVCCSYVCVWGVRVHWSVYGSTKGIGKVREYLYLQYHSICTWTPTVHTCMSWCSPGNQASVISFIQSKPPPFYTECSCHCPLSYIPFSWCSLCSNRKSVSVTFATCVGVLFQYSSGSCHWLVLIVTLHSARC